MTIVVTQRELDEALASGERDIIIDSPAGVWIALATSGSATVHASGSATVHAYGSATVRASGSATVRAYDSATVRASDSATVHAGSHVAVHLHSSRVTVSGGVSIDVTDLDLDDASTWLAYKGIQVDAGRAVLYKAVSPDLMAGQGWRPTKYPIGDTVTADDWRSTSACGHGLHFGHTPDAADLYYQGDETERRYLACEVDVDTLIPLGDKAKAPSCRVLHEVDIAGRKVHS